MPDTLMPILCSLGVLLGGFFAWVWHELRMKKAEQKIDWESDYTYEIRTQVNRHDAQLGELMEFRAITVKFLEALNEAADIQIDKNKEAAVALRLAADALDPPVDLTPATPQPPSRG